MPTRAADSLVTTATLLLLEGWVDGRRGGGESYLRKTICMCLGFSGVQDRSPGANVLYWTTWEN